MESILQKMKKMFGDKVGLYFLTETKNIEDAKFLLKYMDLIMFQ